MGNDQSDLRKFVINNKAIETKKYWTLHYAEVPKSDPSFSVSVFRSVESSEGQTGPFFHDGCPVFRAIRVYIVHKADLGANNFVMICCFFYGFTEFKNLSSPIPLEVHFIVER